MTKDLDAETTIYLAHEGNYARLIERLRDGTITREEMAVAADILEGKVKAREHRRAKTRQARGRAVFIVRTVRDLEAKGIRRKAAVMEVAKEHKCSERTVRAAIKAHPDLLQDDAYPIKVVYR